MPIYEYVCTACDHRADILHGISDPGPHFCPSCGREATMRKQFAPPAIHYKGSGWAKKDRGSASGGTRASSGASAARKSDGGSGDGAAATAGDSGGGSSASNGSSASDGSSASGKPATGGEG
jgi:putative FmdB family regulatory protein